MRYRQLRCIDTWCLKTHPLVWCASKSQLCAGDSSPPLQAQTPEGGAPARAPSIALKKRVTFTGLTVELFEDVEEVNLTLPWTAVLSPRMWRPLSEHRAPESL